MPIDDFRVQISGTVLGDNVSSDLKNQLKNIKNLSVTVDKVSLGQTAIADIKNTLASNQINLKVDLGGAALKQQARTVGQDVGRQLQNSINNIIQKSKFEKIFKSTNINNSAKVAEEYFKKLSSTVSVEEKLGKNNNLTSFTVSLKNAEGATEHLRYAIEHLKDDAGNITDSFFRYTGGSINDNGIIKQFNAIMSKANDFQIELEKLKSKYSDLNSAKPIKNPESVSALNQQYNKVLQSITALKATDESTFASMQSNVKVEISALDNMIERFRNAEYAATALRTKDIPTIKIDEGNNLNAFVAKMERSGHYTDTLKQKVNLLKEDLSKAFDKNSLNEYLNKFSNLQSEFKSVDAAAKTLENSIKLQRNKDSESTSLNNLKQELKDSGALTDDLNIKIESLLNSLKQISTQTGLTTWRAELKGVKSDADALLRQLPEVNKIKYNIETGKQSAEVAIMTSRLKEYGEAEADVKQRTDALNQALKNLLDASKSGSNEKLIESQKEYQKELDTSKNKLKELAIEGGKINPEKNIALSNKMEAWLQKNSAAAKDFGAQIEILKTQLQNADNVSFQRIKNEFDTLTNKARAAGKLGKSFGDSIKTAASSFGQWITVTSVMMRAVETIKDMARAVYDVDTAMTNLYKVTDETSSKYSQFLLSSEKSAKQLGRTVSGLIEQSATWAKLGFSLDESEKLSKISSIYANVGEVDDTTAVTDLVTAIKAFNFQASDSIKIVNSLNKLGNEFATDAASLGQGLKNSASALKLAGNDFDQTLAMITGGTEIVQNASEMGNALKVLSMRLRGMKGELQELGEEYENVESISKIQTQILNQTQGTVNIFDDSGNFKSTYEILKEISEVWDHISQTDQASLLEIIAGKSLPDYTEMYNVNIFNCR